jgi:hypothetical protein
MKRTPTTRRPLGHLRRSLLWAVAGLMLAGVVEIHTGHEGSLEPFMAGDRWVYVCPDGHASTLHVEAALAVERHQCPACLQQVQTAGGHLAAAATLAPPTASGLPASAAAPAPSRRPGFSPGARAPPRSS